MTTIEELKKKAKVITAYQLTCKCGWTDTVYGILGAPGGVLGCPKCAEAKRNPLHLEGQYGLVHVEPIEVEVLPASDVRISLNKQKEKLKQMIREHRKSHNRIHCMCQAVLENLLLDLGCGFDEILKLREEFIN